MKFFFLIRSNFQITAVYIYNYKWLLSDRNVDTSVQWNTHIATSELKPTTNCASTHSFQTIEVILPKKICVGFCSGGWQTVSQSYIYQGPEEGKIDASL